MTSNRISTDVSEEQVADILGHIEAIRTALPFLIGLEPGDRRNMLKAGDRSHAFIHKAMEVGHQIEEHLPRSLDLEEMRKDVAVMDALYPVMLALSQLTQKLTDTYAVANSEAYAAALVVYRSAKVAKGTTGLTRTIDDLGRRFQRRGRANPPSAEADAGLDDAQS